MVAKSVLLALSATAASAEIFGQSNAVPDGSYIFQIEPDYIPHMDASTFLQTVFNGEGARGATVRKEFTIGPNFKAFMVEGLPEAEAERMSNHAPHVKAVSANQVFKLFDQPAAAAADDNNKVCDRDTRSKSWGISRTQTTRPATVNDGYSVADDECGAGVTLFIIDSGIFVEHNDLDGRAMKGFNGVSNEPDEDFIGHGTHVSSTAMGNTYGLARCAQAQSVKVCDFYGNCSLESLLAGMEYTAQQTSRGRSVVNMSLGGNRNEVFNGGAEAMVQAGALVVAAAGNDRIDACGISPASAEGVYTVMASESNDSMATFSNYGTCCDIIAPGSLIAGAWANRGPDGESLQSGTSMSSPHVAGVMAKYWSANPSLSAQEVIDAVDDMALRDAATGLPAGSPNKMLYMPSGCDSAAAAVSSQ